MAEKTDRRQARTRRLLHGAMLALIAEGGMDRLNVSELTNRADIHRGTFYLHYPDIPAMLAQTKREFLDGFAGIICKLNLRQLMDHAIREEPYSVIVGIAQHFSRNADYCRLLLGPQGDPAFQTDIQQLMKLHMYDKLSIYQPLDAAMLLPRDFLIAYVSSANMGIIRHWLETGCVLSPQELTLLLQRMIKHGPLASAGIKPAQEPNPG